MSLPFAICAHSICVAARVGQTLLLTLLPAPLAMRRAIPETPSYALIAYLANQRLGNLREASNRWCGIVRNGPRQVPHYDGMLVHEIRQVVDGIRENDLAQLRQPLRIPQLMVIDVLPEPFQARHNYRDLSRCSRGGDRRWAAMADDDVCASQTRLHLLRWVSRTSDPPARERAAAVLDLERAELGGGHGKAFQRGH